MSLGFLITILLFFLCNSVSLAETTNENEKVVRVAYVISENFQEGEEGEHKYGYGYEYLQKISYYTGWKYEYVYGGFRESLERLISGEVDLMGNLSYTEERAELINFSTIAQGKEFFYLYSYEGNEISDFNGIKVGINAGSYQVELFQTWCAKNNVTCEIIEYDDLDDRMNDLKTGKIDATVANDAYLDYNWVPLVQIGEAPYYYGVNKNQTELLEELNNAMDTITTINPFYSEDLRAKYNSTSVVLQKLTESEKEWLEGNPKTTIGYLSSYMPYCEQDKETGQATGLLIDLLDNIKEEYSMNYEAVAFDTYDEMKEALENGEVDAIFPVYGDYSLGEDENIMISDKVTTSTMTIFNSRNSQNENKKVAVTLQDPFQEQYIQIYYPDAQITMYDSMSDCVHAVLNGEVDCTVIETATTNEIDEYELEKKIQKTILQESIDINFGVKWGNTHLLALLNKGILVTDDSLITNSLIIHSQESKSYTVTDFLREHIIGVFITVIAIFGLILAIVISYYLLRTKSQRHLLELEEKANRVRWKAEHDSLTGLLNRTAFQEIIQNLKMIKKPLGLLIIDVDKFKQINDTYGHEMGDKALAKVAKLLQKSFKERDYVIRYAGDEFIVIVMNTRLIECHAIGSRIQLINKKLQNSEDDVPNLSISVGMAFSSSGYRDTLFKKADQALYSVKENGRCGYAIY
jgi:diguanylate cyclase (GGDEF)-like protein